MAPVLDFAYVQRVYRSEWVEMEGKWFRDIEHEIDMVFSIKVAEYPS